MILARGQKERISMKTTLQTTHKRAAVVPGRQFFSLDEANRSLVLVQRIVGDIMSGHTRLLDYQETFEAAQMRGSAAESDSVRQKLIAAIGKLRGYLDELAAIGVEPKDWSLGIVDFPAMAGRKEIRLCWRWGEPEVLFWHEIDQGFSARQAVELLEPAAV